MTMPSNAPPPGDEPMPPPQDPWYRRYWGYFNRPRGGCGCLYLIILAIIAWLIIMLIFPSLAFWDTAEVTRLAIL